MFCWCSSLNICWLSGVSHSYLCLRKWAELQISVERCFLLLTVEFLKAEATIFSKKFAWSWIKTYKTFPSTLFLSVPKNGESLWYIYEICSRPVFLIECNCFFKATLFNGSCHYQTMKQLEQMFQLLLVFSYIWNDPQLSGFQLLVSYSSLLSRGNAARFQSFYAHISESQQEWVMEVRA